MATQALYRTWRPTHFRDVHGQEAIITTLQNQVASGRISHAYLFSGSRGTGKTSTAKIFARAVNCTSPKGGEPCGTCDACLALSAENNLDIVEIDAASNNGVDEIRDLRDKIKYPPQHGRYRVYIIDEVHMLSTGAFNALLKTLEEPPAHALFILATTEPQRLPATVLSRVQRYDFGRIPAQTIVQRLREIVQGEHADVPDDALMLIARASEGGMRDAISLLDMALAYGGGSVDAALVRSVLGAADRSALFAYADALLSGDAAAALRLVDNLMRAGHEVHVFLRDVTAHLRALMLAQTAGDALCDLLETTGEEAEQYRAQSAKTTRERLLLLLDLFLAAENNIKWAGQPRIALEVASVRACLPEKTLQLEQMAARIDLLEKKLAQGVAIAATAAPAASAPAKQKSAAKPAPPPGPPVADDAVWEKAKGLLRKEPHLFAPLSRGAFQGVRDGVCHITYPAEGQIFLNMLQSGPRRERIEAVLSEAAGRPIQLSVSQEKPPPADVQSAEALHQQAFDVFGRDKVQIVDTPEEP